MWILVKRQEIIKLENAFRELLKSTGEIKGDSEYKDIKPLLVNRSAYKQLTSSSTKERLFNEYKQELNGNGNADRNTESNKAEDDSQNNENDKKLDKESRVQASLKAREEKVRKDKERMEKATKVSKSNLNAEESEREFRTLLIDTVRNHNAKWKDEEPLLKNDKRFNMNIPHKLKRDLFEEHVESIYNRRLKGVLQLFEQHSHSLKDEFGDVYSKIKNEIPVQIFGAGEKELDKIFNRFQDERFTKSKEEFKKLLNESRWVTLLLNVKCKHTKLRESFVDYWGRVNREQSDKVMKDAKAVFGEKDEEEQEEDEGEYGGGNKDISQLAKQVDLKEIHSILQVSNHRVHIYRKYSNYK